MKVTQSAAFVGSLWSAPEAGKQGRAGTTCSHACACAQEDSLRRQPWPSLDLCSWSLLALCCSHAGGLSILRRRQRKSGTASSGKPKGMHAPSDKTLLHQKVDVHGRCSLICWLNISQTDSGTRFRAGRSADITCAPTAGLALVEGPTAWWSQVWGFRGLAAGNAPILEASDLLRRARPEGL